jgi:hypothetical protein
MPMAASAREVSGLVDDDILSAPGQLDRGCKAGEAGADDMDGPLH